MARAIQLRYQSSDRHGLIHCQQINESKNDEKKVSGAYVFTGEISSLMQRLEDRLRDGSRLDALNVMEIMVGCQRDGPLRSLH